MEPEPSQRNQDHSGGDLYQAIRYLRQVFKVKRSLYVALGLVSVAIGLILMMGGLGSGSARRVRDIPVTQKVAAGPVLIKQRERVDYRIEITPNMHNAEVVGTFTAYGGSTSAVSAVIMEQSEYAEWISGHWAKSYYSSNGLKNTDKFAVRLDPGMYCFGISNRLSTYSSKIVYFEVDLIYYRQETF